MNTNMVINLISRKPKGQFFNMSYITDVPMTASAKKKGHVVLKYTHGTFRWGVNYSNLKSVKEREAKKITDKATEVVATERALPWGEWSAEHPGLVINHKGQSYIRLYFTPNKPKSTYYLDGRPITVDDLMGLGIVQNSYWTKNKEPRDCLTVKAANIQNIF